MDDGIEFILTDEFEWKLELEEDHHVEKAAGCKILIFANNGFGDYLFLRVGADGHVEDSVYMYRHEGPVIEALEDDLELLLELKKRKPSEDEYPAACYETGESIEIGDRVMFRTWISFWRRQLGVVVYVPGKSRKNYQYENGGLKWIAARNEELEIGFLIDPETGVVRKIRCVERTTGKIPKFKRIREDDRSSCLESWVESVVVIGLLFGAIYLGYGVINWFKHLLFD